MSEGPKLAAHEIAFLRDVESGAFMRNAHYPGIAVSLRDAGYIHALTDGGWQGRVTIRLTDMGRDAVRRADADKRAAMRATGKPSPGFVTLVGADGTKVYVREISATAVTSREDGAVIGVSNGQMVAVSETPDEVMDVFRSVAKAKRLRRRRRGRTFA